MPSLISKRWCRLTGVLVLIGMSAFVINSQMQVADNSDSSHGSVFDVAGNSRRANGPQLSLKDDIGNGPKRRNRHAADGEVAAVDQLVHSVNTKQDQQNQERHEEEVQLPRQKENPTAGDDMKPNGRPNPPGPHLPPGALFVCVLILSETPDAPHRRAVRNSWAKQLSEYKVDLGNLVGAVNGDRQVFTADSLYRHFFVVGRLAGILDYVREEMEKERDVVMVNENDYASTTAKLYSAFMWAKVNLEFEYVLKTQDRVYLNIPGVIRWLADQPRKKLYAGHEVHLARVMKKTRSPWYMADKFYSNKFYPDYLLSFAFILSRDNVEMLLTAWRDYLTVEVGLLHIDDLDVGIAMKNWSIPPVHCPQFFRTFNTGICKNHQVLAVGEVPRDKLQALGETSLQGSPAC